MTEPGGSPERTSAEPLPRPERNRILDVLRTVALLRVVAYHVTGIDPLTWIASMPLMFFVAGALYARSCRSRPGPEVVADRMRRILSPLAVYAGALVALYAWEDLLSPTISSVRAGDGTITGLGIYDAARLFFPLLSLEPPTGPGGIDDAVYWTWVPLWYVHTHLLLVVVGPLLVRAYRRRRPWLIAGVALFWLVDLVASRGEFNTPTFVVFFVAGFAFDDGTLPGLPRRRLGRMAVISGVVGLALVPAGPGLAITQWAPSLLLIGTAWVCAGLRWRELLERLSTLSPARQVIEFANRRSLSIYLWSLVGVYLSRLLMPVDGLDLDQLVLVALGSLALTAVVTLAACVAVGWVEDLAARRRPQLWPTSH